MIYTRFNSVNIKNLFSVFLLLFCTTYCYTQHNDTIPNSRGYIVNVGDPAPNFKITFDDGQEVTLSDFRGKVVMLQFTASWCSVCRKEMPFIENEIWKKHLNDNFVLIGIDRDEPLEKLIQLKKSTNISYPLGLDPGADIFGLYATKKSGITRNVIIDEDGKIIMLTRLFDREEFDKMKEVIIDALNALK